MHRQANTLASKPTSKKVISVAASILAIIFIVIIAYWYSNPANRLVNLNQADVVQATGNASYSQTLSNKVTVFIPSLRSIGYMASSVSAFNYTGGSISSYMPVAVTSAIFLMTNASSAKEIASTLLFSHEVNNSQLGYIYNSTTVTTFSASGQGISIFDVHAIAAYNQSSIRNMSAGGLPIYEETLIFSFGNKIGMIELNGYGYLSDSIGTNLAEALIKKYV